MSIAAVVLLILGTDPNAWPAFLGQGASPIQADSIPLKWSPTEQIAWSAKLPGKGQSSPVIFGDLVFVTSIEGSMKEHCHVTALNLADGSVVWSRDIKAAQTVRSNYFQSRSAPTPAVDDHAVYAFFETGNLVAISHQGQILWERVLTEDFGPFESTIGLACSPLLMDDSVVLMIDHEGPSYLVAIEKVSGKVRWKTERESRVSFASPALVPVGESMQIVCSSAGSVDGYDPRTGTCLWSYSDSIGGNRSATPLPVGGGRFVIAASPGMHNENETEARRSNGVMEIRQTGQSFTAEVMWRTEEAMPAFNSPLVHEGLAYWVNRAGVVFCFDAVTGRKHYAKRIAQGCWATPIGIGNRVYVFGKDGLTTVLKSGPEFEVLSENSLWDAEPGDREGSPRNSAAGHQPASGRPATGKPAAPQGGDRADKDSSEGSTTPSAGSRPAAPPIGGETQRSADGAPNRSPEEEPNARARGENRFADPVQYGVAVVTGSLIVRTGEVVYCLRNAPRPAP